MSCQRNNPVAKFLGWKFSTLLRAKAAALCCICIILSHLGKNRCRTEISTARISLPYDTQFKQKKCFETPSTLNEECRRRRCVSERYCCPWSGLFWGHHYFCYTQHNLFSLLCRLNCFAMKFGDPLEKVSCFGISLFLSSKKTFKNESFGNKVVDRNEEAWDPSPLSRNLLSPCVCQLSCCSFCLLLMISEEKWTRRFLEAVPCRCRKLKNVTKLLYLRLSGTFPGASFG